LPVHSVQHNYFNDVRQTGIIHTMSDIHWLKKYEIGHKRIDFEHQIFVDLISKIDDAVKLEKDNIYIKGLLKELHAYTTFHFISEENIMYSINYPEYETHKELHYKLLDTYNQKSLEISLKTLDINDFLIFLKDWFVNHTLNEDKKIAQYIEGKDV